MLKETTVAESPDRASNLEPYDYQVDALATLLLSSVQHFKHLVRLHSKFNSLPSSTDISVSMTLTEGRRFHVALQVYRVLHKLSPNLNGTFQYAVDITSRTGRNLYHLFIPIVQTALAKRGFYFWECKFGIH